MKESKYIINNSKPLSGSVTISGSKNSTLPILAATLLTDDTCIIRDVPPLSDVYVMEDILTCCGKRASFAQRQNVIEISSSSITEPTFDTELMSKIRASFLVLGPLIAKNKYVKIPMPGGCSIGSRPVDLHLKGLSALGCEIICEHGYVIAKASQLVGTKIYLDFPSVGATENIIMASVLATGVTIIENCAIEPEIVDLANFLISMGANIKGCGTDTIKITGVTSLSGCEYTVIPDRIEAGTFMVAAAITKGDVTINNVVPDHLKPVTAKLQEMNVTVIENGDSIKVYCQNDTQLQSIDIKTLPYPGFPTDLQSQFMTLLTSVSGTSLVTETVFENRFMHVPELIKMGADIKIEGRSAIIDGVNTLSGACVKATDLRAGASLILAGLVANGETEISNIHHIERGYFEIEQKLKSLGANIVKV